MNFRLLLAAVCTREDESRNSLQNQGSKNAQPNFVLEWQSVVPSIKRDKQEETTESKF
jgi:hypothetical protein